MTWCPVEAARSSAVARSEFSTSIFAPRFNQEPDRGLLPIGGGRVQYRPSDGVEVKVCVLIVCTSEERRSEKKEEQSRASAVDADVCCPNLVFRRGQEWRASAHIKSIVPISIKSTHFIPIVKNLYMKRG